MNTSKMKALVLTNPGHTSINEIAKPQLETGQVLIRVRAVGICGSDLLAFEGIHPRRQPPVVLGHEFSGDIVEIGSGAAGFSVGQRVTVLPRKSCGKCSFCKEGRTNMCDSRSLLGTNSWPGAFAEYVAAPQEAVFTLPEKLDYAIGALAEPLAVAVHAIGRAKVGLGDRVIIFGAGTIGLLTLICSKMAGVQECVVTDLQEYNLKVALSVGATQIFKNSGETLCQMLLGPKGECLMSKAFIAASYYDLLNQAFGIVQKGGTITLIGQFDQPGVIDIEKGRLKEQTIISSSTYTEKDYKIAIHLLSLHPDLFSILITHTTVLKHAARYLENLQSRKMNAVKVIIEI